MNSCRKPILPNRQVALSSLHIFCSFVLATALLVQGCKSKQSKPVKEKEIVIDPATINTHVSENLQDMLAVAIDSGGKVSGEYIVFAPALVDRFYESVNYNPVWTNNGAWLSMADSLLQYLDTSSYDGLFAAHYQDSKIRELKKQLDGDSVRRLDAVSWTKAELLFTSALFGIVQDIGQGRLHTDSLSWSNDSSRHQKHFFSAMQELREKKSLTQVLQKLHPTLSDYRELRAVTKSFVDSMDRKDYTYVGYPFKPGDARDSLRFIKQLQLRLTESEDSKSSAPGSSDSAAIATSIRKYQKRVGLPVDGKISSTLVKRLNLTDAERFVRLAITLDRYKLLPDTLPEKYIWVNLPSYQLKVIDADTVALVSRIICGKPGTPTPQLVSAISDLVIYPTWTVPESIIRKEMLPALKKNSGYLARKGLNLYTFKGERVDPNTVNWSKYTKGIPYKVQQGSGDDNALGVIKFNFANPYAVYLHDTNQRYLFKNSMRSLSHGCVRVQEWQKLAFFIVRNDSSRILPDTLSYTTDSISNWIANQSKHRVAVKFPVPLYIRYFSCEAVNGKIRFYEDIYGDDKKLKDRFFK